LPDGSILSHEDLSYGQKRLLSFLYYAACNPDSKHDRALATNGFPADAVFAVEKSYTAAVLHLLDCDALGAALERTQA
jgi:hypothetical protein